MTEDPRNYHLARAEREETLAARTKDVSSAQAHRQLANLHRAKANQQAPGEPGTA